MFENIAKGFVIGLMVSSPMGPINMLTIQRTLSSGRKHGIVTGVGAMLSDLIYAVLTMTAMEFVSKFQAQYDFWLQLFGELYWCCLDGLFPIQPNERLRLTVLQEGGRLLKDFISSFLLTFSNVGIVVVFVGFIPVSLSTLCPGTCLSYYRCWRLYRSAAAGGGFSLPFCVTTEKTIHPQSPGSAQSYYWCPVYDNSLEE